MVNKNALRLLYWDIVNEIEISANDSDYIGSGIEVDNSSSIFERCLHYNIVDQEWFDQRLKATAIELYCEIILVLGSHVSLSRLEPEQGMFINSKSEKL